MMLRPSAETYKLWGKKAQWFIYLDLTIAFLGLFQIPFAIAGAATANYYYVLAFSIPSPLASALISLTSLHLSTRCHRSPTFALSQSLIQLGGWSGSLIFITIYNLLWGWMGWADSDFGTDEGNWGVLAVASLCACVIVLLLIPYIVLSCMGVHRHRNIKRETRHQGARINLESLDEGSLRGGSLGTPETEKM